MIRVLTYNVQKSLSSSQSRYSSSLSLIYCFLAPKLQLKAAPVFSLQRPPVTSLCEVAYLRRPAVFTHCPNLNSHGHFTERLAGNFAFAFARTCRQQGEISRSHWGRGADLNSVIWSQAGVDQKACCVLTDKRFLNVYLVLIDFDSHALFQTNPGILSWSS